MDLQVQKDTVVLVTLTGKVIAVPHTEVPVREYSRLRRASRGWFPLAKGLGYEQVSLADHVPYPSDAKVHYGLAAGHKQRTRKVVVDNGVVCQPIQQYTLVSVDIETYNEVDHHTIPLVE